MYMLQALTVAALLLPPQTTLDVCHVCKKKITERVSDKTHAYLPLPMLHLPLREMVWPPLQVPVLFKLMSSSSNQCQVNLPWSRTQPSG